MPRIRITAPYDAPGLCGCQWETMGNAGNKKPRKCLTDGDFWQTMETLGSMCGAGDRTRTGKPIKAADFRHTASFKAGVAKTTPFVRWTMPSPSRAGVLSLPVRLRRPPSSLYTFLASAAPRGLARCCLDARRASGVSPNLKGSAPAVSGRALNRLSPLCLPISSPRQKGGRDSTIASRIRSPIRVRRIAPRRAHERRRHRHRSFPAPQPPAATIGSATLVRNRTPASPPRVLAKLPRRASSRSHKRFR